MIKIIAELAQGYEGKPEQTQLLVLAAAKAGADAAKLQLVYADELCTPDYKDYKLFGTLEMPDTVWAGLATQTQRLNIELHLDIFGPRSLALAEGIGAQAVKIHGTDMGNVGLLEAVAKSKIRTVLLGAGGGFLPEINTAVEILGAKQIVILLGFQGYPTPNETNQIDRVRAMVKRYAGQERITVGFADHAPPEDALSMALAATAVGAGARVLEKHLTLGRIMKLEDHESALNPDQFAVFVQCLRACAEAVGATSASPDFGMSAAELHYRQWTRKHVVTRRAIKTGELITPDAVVLKRTPAKSALTDFTSVYGQRARRDIAAGQPITAGELQGE
jgi:N,N'-diacetyllegionaminate synthase